MPYKDKEAQREYQRKWCAARRSEAVAALGGKCAKCGSTDDLELAHKERGTKTVLYAGTRQAVNWSWKPERIAAELPKCKLLCVRCHTEETALENTVPLVHGTLSGYKKDCRCSECRAANAAYEHERRYSLKLSNTALDARGSTSPSPPQAHPCGVLMLGMP